MAWSPTATAVTLCRSVFVFKVLVHMHLHMLLMGV